MTIQEFYQKLSAKERKVFYVAIAFVVIASFDALFMRPVLSRLREIEEEIADKSNSIERDLRFLAYRDRIALESNMVKTFDADAADLSEDQVISAFLETVERLASESQISVVKLNPALPERGKGHIFYQANLESTGRLEDMFRFMHRIITTNNLLRIDRMTMTGNKASAEEVRVSMQLSKLIIDPNSLGDGTVAGAADGEASGRGAGGSSGAGENGGPGGNGGSGSSGAGKNGGPGGRGSGNGAGRAGQGGSGGKSKNGNGGSSEGRGSSDGMSGDSNASESSSSSGTTDDGSEKSRRIDGFATGERVHVSKSLGELWSDFWGGGGKVEDGGEAGGGNDKKNFWERMFRR